MDPESKKLLQDTFALTQENTSMLRSMRRSMRLQRIMSFVYWLFIIGSAIGAYYLIQPYVEQYKNLYNSTSNIFKDFQQ
ncbi:hypothetical protein A2814_01345 [Candidatus Nomurabacteria bacterium RIFCSPHIGHO2_01_FULL_38_19]|uniref:Uncharacterized protein n=1 Tax=Candidatus Nomurabacteria bacterium RIFCSPHIGHO2_01_FULL_38_19 TaxID=1801732 RepID=A0A1F6UQQ3_9BACT|nr:MAG: hypothetical protein A2814_01345 [Candidatus Nomurabacteria bacterium RIFCSPHIGHO2_01_FULL_38_19]